MDLITKKKLSISTTPLTKIADYAAFFKLRLASLVVFSAVLGYLIAADSIVWVDLAWLCIGGFLVTGSSNGYNQIIEKSLDKLMDRTKVRPLVTGRMTRNEAVLVAGIAGVTGILILWFFLNQLSGVLALISLILYVAVYTPLKQKTSWAVFVGAFPGAIPPMLGWVAATGHFGLEPGLLFALQFMWQFPHFWAIAWKASDDYAKAGFYLLPSKGGKDFTSAFLILLYSLFLLLLSVLPVVFGFTGNIALFFIIAAGIMMIYPAIQLFKNKSDKAATKVMFASFIYVPVVLLAWYLDKI
tara:strand:- start:11812 stop:12708 length:897 start_codon:yes stop_codon:yes gene_type:complete